MPPHGNTKRRVYDAEREFLGNYQTSIVKEEALQNAIDGDLKEGLVSAPCDESGIRAKFPKASRSI